MLHEVDATKLADHFPWISSSSFTTATVAASTYAPASDNYSEHIRGEVTASSANPADHQTPATEEVSPVESTNPTALVKAPSKQFDRVVFNFPHWGGQGHIERNRKLLASFFASVAPLLAPHGEVRVGGWVVECPVG